MPKNKAGPIKKFQLLADSRFKEFTRHYGDQMSDILDFPVKLVLSPFTLAIDFVGSAPRGFGVPELISKLSLASVFAVATLGTYDIALDLGKKVICQRQCRTCSGWQALCCTMCRGSGRVQYQVKNYTLRSGEKATAECLANAISENRAEVMHIPSAMNLGVPLPFKDCPSCDGTGVMVCPGCKEKLNLRISGDDIMDPPWKAYNVLSKMTYPYEASIDSIATSHIRESMRDPSIAAFWLFTFPQVVGGLNHDDDVKKKIWWQYKESSRYDQLRDVVAKRAPGWEILQEAMISIDPVRAREDPIVVKSIPYYRAKKALEAEIMRLDPPPRPQKWGELDLPLNASSWSEDDLTSPEKLVEMNVLLNAQREIAEKILDTQWEAKWRQEKLNQMLEEKVQPYMKEVDNGILSGPIVVQQQTRPKELQRRRKRWWIF
ncbi:hypothetical protein LINGRAHAP2_LOCUS31939 [Linum grandiflorum]